jgi:[ribosomal protein S5]-alanine N-acetyltransferase
MDKAHVNFKIRSFEESDAESLAKYANNKKIWCNLKDFFPYPYTLADARFFIGLCTSKEQMTTMAIELEGVCIGAIGFNEQSDIYRKTAEFGYWLGEPFWGKGIMTKAVKSYTSYIFDNFDIIRIHAGVFEWNAASMRVLEKAGFYKECIRKSAAVKEDKIIDIHSYCLLRN